MNDPHIVSNLRARLPGALAELFDAYGDRLFRYCWTMLRNHEIAQIALRDTLVVAEAHIARLADPELLGPWLYSLARAECCRRRAVQPSLADEPPARPSQHDADDRLMAWNAVMNMATDELEALDLTCRHDVDLALVLGVSAEDARVLLGRARQSLERALGAETLIAKGDGCLERADILDGLGSGTVTSPIRERLMRHAEDCPRCQLDLPRDVSAARVFAQLPAPELSPLVRAQVLGLFANPKLSAYREFAVNWASALGESGFPVTSEPPAPERPRSAAETAAALAGLSTVALPVFGPAGSGLSGSNLSAPAAPAASSPAPGVPAPLRPMADALGAGLAAADWPTADLPAVDVPVADVPAASRPIADVPAARRPVGDMPVADRAAVSAPAATYRMANCEVGSPAELGFASAEPTPASASSAVPRQATMVSAALDAAAFKAAASTGAAATSTAAKAAASKAAAPAPAPGRPAAPEPEPGRPAAPKPAPTRPAGGGRPRVRRKRAILAGVGMMAAAAAIVSSFILNGSAGKLVTAAGATSAGRTASPSGLSASSAPILEPQPGAPPTGTAPTGTAPTGTAPTGTARAGSRTPQSRPAPLPALAPAEGDRRKVLITRATQPLTASSVPRPGTPHQPAAPTSAAAPTAAAESPARAPSAGTLSISSGSVDVGTGATSQVTLTAVGGSVSWSASMSSRQVRLTSYHGTLQAGQSVTLDIAVDRGAQGGRAVIWIEPPAATPLTVQVAWQSLSPGSGHEGQNAQDPPTANPWPSAPLPPGAG